MLLISEEANHPLRSSEEIGNSPRDFAMNDFNYQRESDQEMGNDSASSPSPRELHVFLLLVRSVRYSLPR